MSNQFILVVNFDTILQAAVLKFHLSQLNALIMNALFTHTIAFSPELSFICAEFCASDLTIKLRLMPKRRIKMLNFY